MEQAVGDCEVTAKKDRGWEEEDPEPEGSPAKSTDGRPFPRPKLGGSDAPHVWAAQSPRYDVALGKCSLRRARYIAGCSARRLALLI